MPYLNLSLIDECPMSKITSKWEVDFIDWGHIPTIRAILTHNGHVAVCWQENNSYHCCIDYQKTRKFSWPSQARRYAVRVLAATKPKEEEDEE